MSDILIWYIILKVIICLYLVQNCRELWKVTTKTTVVSFPFSTQQASCYKWLCWLTLWDWVTITHLVVSSTTGAGPLHRDDSLSSTCPSFFPASFPCVSTSCPSPEPVLSGCTSSFVFSCISDNEQTMFRDVSGRQNNRNKSSSEGGCRRLQMVWDCCSLKWF